MECCDITIPVPWGIIAGKTYGKTSNQFVLVVHGLQDNCGSFDRLLPHLPQTYHYVCIDLPSHGKSSYMPGNLLINTIDYVLVYKLILDYFKRSKYIIIGHSYGGQIALHFTQLYPEYVLKLILLDTIYFYPLVIQSYKNTAKAYHDEYYKILVNQASPDTKPSYTYEEALQKSIISRVYSNLTKEAAEPMLKRNIEQLPNGRYRFTIDPRLKAIVNPGFTMDVAVRLVKKHPIKCHLLIILASETPQSQYFKAILKALRETNKLFKMKIVAGDHDVHNKHPERVAPLICDFLTTSRL